MQTDGFHSIALTVRIGLLAGGSRERLLANHQLRSVQPLRETLRPHMTFAALGYSREPPATKRASIARLSVPFMPRVRQ
jgi:hypothetical protein